ncbi:MAG: Gfo/Idh/MocA family oxidoreductase [Chloroflexi bacterium]|nr:Gfo/Idh/MocA family oxidoreductase [Chloroflexota bacterium]
MDADPANADPYMYNGFPMNTPMDIRLGLTNEDGIHHRLRWGIIAASAISSDWVKSLQDVPGASVVAIAARDKDRASAYADAHGIPMSYDSYEALCNDPNIDIVYISSKTWHHHRDLMMAIAAGKHVLCEKPFTDTADQAKEAYAAAEKAGVVCWEGMWTSFFPAIEHARAAIERGDIGELQVVQSDYPDPVYALNPVVAGFGTSEFPVIAAAGGQPLLRDEAVAKTGRGAFTEGYSVGHPCAAVLQYPRQRGIGVVTMPSATMPTARFKEETLFVGTEGRITVETPAHHPTALTVATGRPPRRGNRSAKGKPDMEYTSSGGRVGDWLPTHWNQDQNPSSGAFNHVERFEYPVPNPAPIHAGNPAGSRWTGEKLITYKGWTWGHGNQHGFTYQARAVHRCMEAGLKEMPQFTVGDSIHVCEIIDEIKRQCAERGF